MLKPLEMTRLTLMSRRSPVLRTPKDVGLDFEDVSFTASDGVPLVGWFIPRSAGDSSGAGPVVVFVHGWMWNRLGNVAGAVPFTDRDVDFLPAVKALHDAGYHVLLFDLANHGESGSRPPVTYGPWESRDYLGAVAYLRTRGDVDEQRIGVLGLSMGGNAAIYGTPYCQPIKAMLLVQPSRAGLFTERFAKDQLGRLGTAMVRPLDLVYAAAHAPLLRDHDPGDAAVLLGDTLCKYVQGTGDPWGAVSDVQGMVDVTPNVLPLVLYPSTGRYEGYRYITEQPEEVASFFTEYL